MRIISPTPIAPTESFDDLKASIQADSTEAAESVAKKRGRKPGSKNKSVSGAAEPMPVSPIIDPAILTEVVNVPFNFLAARRGEFWKLQENEARTIGELGAKVLTKYSPAFLASFGEEISLALILTMAIGARIAIDAQERAEKKAEAEKRVANPPRPIVVDQRPEGANPFRAFTPHPDDPPRVE